mmetsp:Transcript_34879/g.81539  ORF Transcript_34879/g.81539 Transcript_34879/m.81539 type:complete len:858 (-) Transcript_34879:59-2632(-)
MASACLTGYCQPSGGRPSSARRRAALQALNAQEDRRRSMERELQQWPHTTRIGLAARMQPQQQLEERPQHAPADCQRSQVPAPQSEWRPMVDAEALLEELRASIVPLVREAVANSMEEVVGSTLAGISESLAELRSDAAAARDLEDRRMSAEASTEKALYEDADEEVAGIAAAQSQGYESHRGQDAETSQSRSRSRSQTEESSGIAEMHAQLRTMEASLANVADIASSVLAAMQPDSVKERRRGQELTELRQAMVEIVECMDEKAASSDQKLILEELGSLRSAHALWTETAVSAMAETRATLTEGLVAMEPQVHFELANLTPVLDSLREVDAKVEELAKKTPDDGADLALAESISRRVLELLPAPVQAQEAKETVADIPAAMEQMVGQGEATKALLHQLLDESAQLRLKLLTGGEAVQTPAADVASLQEPLTRGLEQLQKQQDHILEALQQMQSPLVAAAVEESAQHTSSGQGSHEMAAIAQPPAQEQIEREVKVVSVNLEEVRKVLEGIDSRISELALALQQGTSEREVIDRGIRSVQQELTNQLQGVDATLRDAMQTALAGVSAASAPDIDERASAQLRQDVAASRDAILRQLKAMRKEHQVAEEQSSLTSASQRVVMENFPVERPDRTLERVTVAMRPLMQRLLDASNEYLLNAVRTEVSGAKDELASAFAKEIHKVWEPVTATDPEGSRIPATEVPVAAFILLDEIRNCKVDLLEELRSESKGGKTALKQVLEAVRSIDVQLPAPDLGPVLSAIQEIQVPTVDTSEILESLQASQGSQYDLGHHLLQKVDEVHASLQYTSGTLLLQRLSDVQTSLMTIAQGLAARDLQNSRPSSPHTRQRLHTDSLAVPRTRA